MSDLLKAIIAFGHIYKKVGNTYVDVNTNKLLLLTEEKVREGVELYEKQKKIKSLRVLDYMDSSANPLIQDFSIMGLVKKAPHYDRGRKTSAEYIDPETNEIVVRKIFRDLRDDNDKLIALVIDFQWYCKDGSIGLEKSEVVENLSKAKAKTIERIRRERSWDFLLSEGEDSPIESLMEELVIHYEDVKNEYLKYGKDDFKNAIENETDEKISNYLSIRVPFTSNNDYTASIKDSVLYQINAMSEEEFLSRLELAES